jgi:hypothetical protein
VQRHRSAIAAHLSHDENDLDDLIALVSLALQPRLRRRLAILVVADKWVRVLFLVQVTQRMVDAAVICLVGLVEVISMLPFGTRWTIGGVAHPDVE